MQSHTVITVLAALGGALIGAVIGPWINRRASLETAKRNLEGQRILAQDQARRELRRNEVQPVLDLVSQRSGKYTLWWDAILADRDDGTLRVHQFELWQHTGWPPNPPFVEMFKAYLDADKQLDRLLIAAPRKAVEMPDGKAYRGETVQEVGVALSNHFTLSAELVRLGHDYIVDGDKPATP